MNAQGEGVGGRGRVHHLVLKLISSKPRPCPRPRLRARLPVFTSVSLFVDASASSLAEALCCSYFRPRDTDPRVSAFLAGSDEIQSLRASRLGVRGRFMDSSCMCVYALSGGK